MTASESGPPNESGAPSAGPTAPGGNAQDTDEPAECSAKGCRNTAVWALRWNNPKIHTPDRRKVWLACDEHREHLSQFLDRRDFLRDVVSLADLE